MKKLFCLLNMKRNGLQMVFISMLIIVMLFICGCSSLDSEEYIQSDDIEFQAEDTADETDFELVSALVEENFSSLNVDEQPLIKSWNSEGNKETYYLQLVMDEKYFNALYQSQNDEEIRELWRENLRKPLQSLTKTCHELFVQYGFETAVFAEIVNPFDTDKAILSITDGIVLYDIMGE